MQESDLETCGDHPASKEASSLLVRRLAPLAHGTINGTRQRPIHAFDLYHKSETKLPIFLRKVGCCQVGPWF